MADRITRNYDGNPIPQGYVMVPFPYDEMDRKVNVKNKECIMILTLAGYHFPVIYKAVPAEYAKAAKSSFNSWVNELLGYRRDGRCLIPQPDGSLKECPRKSGNNHSSCKECPDRGNYEKRDKTIISLDNLEEKYETDCMDNYTGKEYIAEDGFFLPDTANPESRVISEEIRKHTKKHVQNTLEKFIDANPKYGYALLLMGNGYKGGRLAEKLLLGHAAAGTIEKDIRNLCADKISHLSEIDLSKLKCRKSSHDEYYRAEAYKLLSEIMSDFDE